MPGWFGNGKSNICEQLRLAVINNGPDYTYRQLKNYPADNVGGKPQRQTLHVVKSDFAFGMSPAERSSLLDRMIEDIRRDSVSGRYVTDMFTNPDAINALRKQAVIWSKSEGNDVFDISRDDDEIKDFFRVLESNVPQEHRQAVSALIDQPPEYRQPLPDTVSEELARLQRSTSQIVGTASNHAMFNPQTVEGADAQQTGASPYPQYPSITSMTSMTSTAGKRSFSSTNIEPTSVNDPSQTNKRARHDDSNGAFPLPSSYGSQSSSFSLPPGFTTQPTAHHQSPPMPQVSNPGIPTDPGEMSQSTLSFDPPQLQSWSASNGTSRMNVQPQPQTYQVADPANVIYQTDTYQGGQYFDHSQIQAPQMQPAYDPWASGYQGNVVQEGPSFDPLQLDESFLFAGYSPAVQLQPTAYVPYQGHQTGYGGVFDAANANIPSFIGQPNYGASSDLGSFNQTSSPDAEWNQLMAAFDVGVQK